jgi:uncharacterized membrane protein YuzA (DUF378 family)
MKLVLANVCFLFGIIGFSAYLFMIIAGFFGCCAGLTTFAFHKIVLIIMALAVVTFIICMFNNCCKVKKAE